MSFVKIHKISTTLAVGTIILTSALLFLSMCDRLLRFNLFPQYLENIIGVIGWGFGTIAIGSTVLSLILSLYRLADKE